jgi:electron transfer DM13
MPGRRATVFNHGRIIVMFRKNKVWICLAICAVLGFGWYLFRPELLFIDRVVSESFPETDRVMASDAANRTATDASTRLLAQGEFHSVAHSTSGTATVHRLKNGSRVLRLTDFETSNGPDVRVYLVAADDASDSAQVTEAGFVELGRMKGNKGNQNYELPSDIDLAHFRAVTIWCKRFSVNFGTAPLKFAAS